MNSDSRLQSLHLGDLPRRDDFRVARAQLEAACGGMTLAGTMPRETDPAPDAPTRIGPALIPGELSPYWLRDGEMVHPLVVGINSLGRLPDNTIVLKDEHVSRRHCAVIVHTSGLMEIHDIASKNGTILNGKKIVGLTQLNSGDYITLCTKKLVVISDTHQTPINNPAPPVA